MVIIIPRITKLQRFSIHDGDGIRTTIFFKGCPLKCLWCHNPETQNFKSELLYDEERCNGCRSCLQNCPNDAITLSDFNKVLTDRNKCTNCTSCLDYCPQNLREITGIEMTVSEIVTEVLKDQIFYEQSNGGVTLSGGEVLSMDIDFIENLLKQLHRQGVSIAIDSCGYTNYDNFKKIIPFTDSFLYDIKMIDNKKHIKYTNVSNELILENLKKLSKEDTCIFLRLPLIKDINDSDNDIQAIIDFLLTNNIIVKRVHLLPYHSIGKNKYNKLEVEYKGNDFLPPEDFRLKEILEKFAQKGFEVKIGG